MTTLSLLVGCLFSLLFCPVIRESSLILLVDDCFWIVADLRNACWTKFSGGALCLSYLEADNELNLSDRSQFFCTKWYDLRFSLSFSSFSFLSSLSKNLVFDLLNLNDVPFCWLFCILDLLDFFLEGCWYA